MSPNHESEAQKVERRSPKPEDAGSIPATLANNAGWQDISTAPRDGRPVWLWNKHSNEPDRYRWSTHYSVFGLGGCWTDGFCTMGDRIDFEFWTETLPAGYVAPKPQDSLPTPPEAA